MSTGPVSTQQRLLEHALQLADVARPGVAAQQVHRLGGDLADLPAQLPVEAPHVVADQHGQVVAALAQGRQVDREDAQAIVEVGAELPLRRRRLQVAVRGRDQPHVGLDRLVAADPLERLFLQHAQDLALRRQRHVADLVEEQRAAVALLELADPPPLGAGEGALLVAEQLALQQRSRGWRRS